MKPPAGALIAGGASARFGSPKAGLKVDAAGAGLASRLLTQMRLAGLEPLVCNAAQAPEDLPEGVLLLPDRRPGLGPLEGLATVLAHVRCPVLVAACDMPGLDADAFRALTRAWDPRMKGLVARGRDGWHPLFGIYGHGLLPELERRLAQGRRALHALVEDESLDAWTAPEPWLVNVNTLQEWEAWQAARRKVV